jgi:OmpA-OmpF porin, OOP family
MNAIGIAAAGLILLAGCASDIAAVKTAQGGPTPFSQALTEEYKGYVANETSNYDWRYAHYFARKGLQAAQGRDVLPEDPASWDVSDKAKSQLVAARQQLIAALDGGARQAKPKEAARAQARFDCWVQKADEGNIPHRTTYLNYDPSGDYQVSELDISNPDEYQVVPCKSAFNAALALIQTP